MKVCTRCSEEKDDSFFPLPKSKICKPCQKRKARLKKVYGLSWEDYSHMLRMQGYACSICKISISNPKQANVDHCHKTEKVRGLLCRGCNLGLGFFQDSVKNLENAIKYLS